MELTLNIGDNINIPENCEVVIENNTLTVKEKQSIFKDGDILVVKDNPSFIVIFKEYSLNRRTFCSYFNNQKLSDTNWGIKCFRHATEEEKQNFYDELEEKGLKWDSKMKEFSYNFKDGDILYSKNSMRVFICKITDGNKIYEFNSYYRSDFLSSLHANSYFRPATKEEEQHLFAELKAKKLKWNAETKTFEKFRVRAKDREKYLTINEFGEVIELDEDNCLYDDKKYNLGNYYILEERKQAEQDAKAVRAIYEKRTKI